MRLIHQPANCVMSSHILKNCDSTSLRKMNLDVARGYSTSAHISLGWDVLWQIAISVLKCLEMFARVVNFLTLATGPRPHHSQWFQASGTSLKFFSI